MGTHTKIKTIKIINMNFKDFVNRFLSQTLMFYFYIFAT